MNQRHTRSPVLPDIDAAPARIAASVRAIAGRTPSVDAARRWVIEQSRRTHMNVRTIPLESLSGWATDETTGSITHRSGRFFSVEGLNVRMPTGDVAHWQQPILNQPEVGILGILTKEFNGVLHCLLQAKIEPGNCNGIQVSPTVQATRSNFTGVHRGAEVPYLEYFQNASAHRVLADIRQSEQGSWFYRKRNRNMIVEVAGDVEVIDGFRWLTLGQIHELLGDDDVINMDARSVLSCLPFAGAAVSSAFGPQADDFTAALIRSYEAPGHAHHTMADILHWITDTRSRVESIAERMPLAQVNGWHREDGRIRHESGLFFSVIGVDVAATGREVSGWSQPMFEPCDEGLVAFVVRQIEGVLHALVHLRAEPGYVDVVELAPTVQCTPSNLDALPASAQPPYLPLVAEAKADDIRYDAVQSEEGGRFFCARNRYVVVEVDDLNEEHPGYRWMTLAQMADLMRHSNYLNIQARSLIASLHSLSR